MITAKQQQRGRTDRQAEHCNSNQALNEPEFQGLRARTMLECRKICQQLSRAALLPLKSKCHPQLLWSRLLSSGKADSASHPAAVARLQPPSPLCGVWAWKLCRRRKTGEQQRGGRSGRGLSCSLCVYGRAQPTPGSSPARGAAVQPLLCLALSPVLPAQPGRASRCLLCSAWASTRVGVLGAKLLV